MGAGLDGIADRTIVLVGLMGAGKTTVGRRLAARLQRPFLDADAEIERAAGCAIAEFFRTRGEAAFREGEVKVIARLLDGPPAVLATGGGAYMAPETRTRIHERGVAVWLRADRPVLETRLGRRGRHKRPLIADGDLGATLDRLIRERYPVYAQADITVESVDGPHDAVVDTIVAALRSWTPPCVGAERRA
ncbi:MAG: shikimate kinase [Alphaproteobacteria bacterium]